MGEASKDVERNPKNQLKAEVVELDNTPKPLDGGWGWMVVLGTAICHVIFGIIVRAFGVTYIELLARFGGSATATAWIGAINMSASGLLSPLVSVLCIRFSCRSVAMLGGVLLATGVIGTAYAPNLITVYFTFGVISGLGTALAYTPGYIIVGEYFEKRKALAMSLATFASGLGAMFPPVMLYLFEHYGYSGALLIIAGISLHCCIGGALYRPLCDNFKRQKTLHVEMVKIVPAISKGSLQSNEEKDSKKTLPMVLQASLESLHSFHSCKEESLPITEEQEELKKQENEGNKRRRTTVTFSEDVIDDNTDDEDVFDEINKNGNIDKPPPRRLRERKESIFHKPNPKQKIFDWSLLKKSRFISLCYGIFCNAFNLGLVSAFIPILAIERGISTTKAVSLLSISGIGSTFGTLFFGYMSDLKTVKPWRVYFYIFCLFMVGLVTVLNPIAQKYATFIVFSCTRAVFAGYIMSQRATIVSDIVGRERMNYAVGMVLFSTALGFLFGRALGGVIKDTTGMYDSAFYIAGASTIFGAGVLLCTEHWHARKRRMLQVA